MIYVYTKYGLIKTSVSPPIYTAISHTSMYVALKILKVIRVPVYVDQIAPPPQYQLVAD